MAIFKNTLREQFTQIPNELITDKNVSAGAFRVAVYLFAQETGWEVNNSDIMNKLGIKSEETLSGYWKTLISVGWIKRVAIRDESGRLTGQYDYEIIYRIRENTESGKIPDQEKTQIRKKPRSGKNRGLNNNNNINNTNNRNNTNDDEGARAHERHQKISTSLNTKNNFQELAPAPNQQTSSLNNNNLDSTAGAFNLYDRSTWKFRTTDPADQAEADKLLDPISEDSFEKWGKQILDDELAVENLCISNKIPKEHIRDYLITFMRMKRAIGEANHRSYNDLRKNFFFWCAKPEAKTRVREYQETKARRVQNTTYSSEYEREMALRRMVNGIK